MSNPIEATTSVNIRVSGHEITITIDEARALVKAINNAIGHPTQVFREPQRLGPYWSPPNNPGFPFPDITCSATQCNPTP